MDLALSSIVNPFTPVSTKWHLQILPCLTPDDFANGKPLMGECMLIQ